MRIEQVGPGQRIEAAVLGAKAGALNLPILALAGVSPPDRTEGLNMVKRIKESRKRKNRLTPVTLNGIEFIDYYNAARYEILAKRLAAGKIKDLIVRPYYPYIVNGRRLWVYRPSFYYVQLAPDGRAMRLVVEDIRDARTVANPLSCNKIAAYEACRVGPSVKVIPRTGLQMSEDRKRAYKKRVKARKIEAVEDEEAALRARVEVEIGRQLPEGFAL